jgi:hypothetical protein
MEVGSVGINATVAPAGHRRYQFIHEFSTGGGFPGGFLLRIPG